MSNTPDPNLTKRSPGEQEAITSKPNGLLSTKNQPHSEVAGDAQKTVSEAITAPRKLGMLTRHYRWVLVALGAFLLGLLAFTWYQNNAAESRAELARWVETERKQQETERKRTEAHSHWTKGSEALSKGDYDLAISWLNRAVELDPHNYTFLFDRARACIGKPDYNQAVSDYTEIFRLYPQMADAGAYHNRGLAYIGLKSWDEAIADFTESLKLKPDGQDATGTYIQRSLAYYGKKRYDRSVADLNHVLDLSPNHATAYFLRGLNYVEFPDYFDKAIRDVSEAIRLDPEMSSAYRVRAYVYNRQSKFALAINDCTQAIRLNANDHEAYRIRAYAYSQLGYFDLSLKDIQQADRLNPSRK